MAIEFARVRYVKRSDGGNVCRSAAYNGREDIGCARTGERFYFAHRPGLLDHQVLLPEGAAERFSDAETLWNVAQAAEKRKDSQEARELLLALPSDPGLSLDDWRVLTMEFATQHFVAKGVAVQMDIHAPHEGERNVHAHLLITTRRLEGEGFAATKARDLDPEVRMAKNGKPLVAEGDVWGAIWRDFQNAYFERLGLDLRVDETGVVAQRHEGPVRLRTVPEAAQARTEASEADNEAASRDPEQVLAALTRRRATFTELDIERQLLKPVPDAAERAALRAEILARPEIVALHERGTGEFAGRYTTQAVRAEEAALLDNAASIARASRPVAARHVAAAAAARTMDDEQQAAFLKATGTDGLVVIEGIAGAGKSYSVEAIREAHERDGWRVVGLAPTNTVAQDMRQAGFAHGSTVHLELYYQENGRHDRAPAWDRRTCLVVDEAAMLDTRTFGRLMERAALAKAKVVLVGDDRQLTSIERGGMFTAVKERHGSAVIAKVRRQEADWQRAASEDFANGRVAEGLRGYAEHDCLVWSDSLEEARTRLLSDWDWDSRERPEVSRFVYASTNAEVNQLNQDIRAIRKRRGEVGEGIAVETTKGAFEVGIGDRLQFFANDRKAGFYNGTLGTVTAVEGRALAVRTDTGRTVRLDPEAFKQFGLGYAGTVYRGQGKTQTEVSALYDNAFSWSARTAYVGMTRHKESVKLYVPTSLARDELALARQMGKRQRDEASLAYATAAEVVDLSAVRRQQEQRQHRAPGEPAAPAPDTGQAASSSLSTPPWGGRLPQEVAALRRLDMTAYARDVHGYAVTPDPQREHHYRATRPAADGGLEVLEMKYVPGGHWTYRNPAQARDRGDILDLAKREGAASLAAARAEIAAYQANRSGAMQPPENRRKRVEEAAQAAIDPKDPDAAYKQGVADDQRRRDLAGTDAADRQEAIAAEAEQRQQAARDEDARQDQFRKEEAEKQARLDTERRDAGKAEQDRLRDMQQTRPADHDSFVAYSGQQAEQARQETGIRGPEQMGRGRSQPSADPAAFPASASLRYTESLARHYDGRDPYGSLARASLAESAQFQREQYDLNRQIAQEGDPDRRDVLTARQDIKHNNHRTCTSIAEVIHHGNESRSDPMREPEHRRHRIEEQARPEINRIDPAAADKQMTADEERRRDLISAEAFDRTEAVAIADEAAAETRRHEEAAKEQFAKEETERQARLAAEAKQAQDREQELLRQAQQTPPMLNQQYVQFADRRAATARRETGLAGPEAAAPARATPAGDSQGYPASASLRYSEALARHYDSRNPYGSLAQASLTESTAFQHDQHELNRQIALESDPTRRDMLLMRRSIEHNDHMGQNWERISGQNRAITGRSDHRDVVSARDKADEFKEAAKENREEWERRCAENPTLYPPLNEQMRARVELRRETSGREAEGLAQEAKEQGAPATRRDYTVTREVSEQDNSGGPMSGDRDDRAARLARWQTAAPTRSAASTAADRDRSAKRDQSKDHAAASQLERSDEGRER